MENKNKLKEKLDLSDWVIKRAMELVIEYNDKISEEDKPILKQKVNRAKKGKEKLEQ